MLSNAYFLAKIGADTAENEQHSAEILPIGRCVATEKLAVLPRHRHHRRLAELRRAEDLPRRSGSTGTPAYRVHEKHR